MPPPSHATIDLHALARPLSRLLYHRQALAFMERETVSPFTADELQLVLTYLCATEIAPRTKGRLFSKRAELLLDSRDLGVVVSICMLLGGIISHEALHANVIDSGTCVALLSLFDNSQIGTHRAAAYTLIKISSWALPHALVLAEQIWIRFQTARMAVILSGVIYPPLESSMAATDGNH
ncbi:hypothetical protein C8J57DRAFT_1522166 [Mycena rebaudengoi]|nr:hypothetical protein C8J57DRAFT_1522166 [Mycena rebaudengoi]